MRLNEVRGLARSDIEGKDSPARRARTGGTANTLGPRNVYGSCKAGVTSLLALEGIPGTH